jgi:hypothetical protein
MDHFTIFQDFYRVIAEMTEEEIVSAISNGTYRETVEDVRRIFAEQGEKHHERKIEHGNQLFSHYRGRSNATLVKYLGYIVVDIDHQTQEALARILALAKKCAHTRIAFITPKGMGLKIVVRVCRTDGTLPETIQEIEDFHHAAYHKIASFYAQLCGVEVDTSGQDVSRTCLFSYDRILFSIPCHSCHRGTARWYSSLKKERHSAPKENDDSTVIIPHRTVALNYHSSHASLRW